MLALNLLNQFTRHFLKWTVCLLWLAPYVDDPSVTFIWMIFTFKIGNYSCLIVVMNEPLFFSSCFAASHYSVFGVWSIWMFSDTNYLSGVFLPLQKFICILCCINTVDNSFHCPLTLLQRSCYSWNRHGHIRTCMYLSKWVWIIVVLPKIDYSPMGTEDVRPGRDSWCSRKHFGEVGSLLTVLHFSLEQAEPCYCSLPFVSKHKEKSEAINLPYQYYSVWFFS